MNAWTAAAVVTWAAGTVVCAAFWVGRGKLINDYKQYVADRACDEYVNREIARLESEVR